MIKLKRNRVISEMDELNKKFKGKTFNAKSDSNGKLFLLETNDDSIIAWAISKGLRI